MVRPPTGFPGALTESAPERLGKYPLLGVIGKGSMGVIYKSFDPHIKRPVALKTIRRDLVDGDCTEDFPARFRQEAQAAGGLAHPGIVAVYEYGEQDAYAYMAMEYVEGRSLRECFEGRVSFSIAQVVDIVSQLLEALQYAHDRGVWHRDIKPANILLMSNGRVKVTDFGIARIESSVLTQLGTIMGTPGFIAPEMYLSDSFDNRIDLFAVGVVLYQLLADTPPFVGSADKVMFKVCYETPLPPSVAGRLPSLRPFDAVVVRALARRPEDRFATARQFLEALRLAHAQLNSGPEGPDETVIRPRPSAAGNSRPSTRESVSQPQSQPPSAAALSATGWNTDELARVEKRLALFVGPVARVMVRHAATKTNDIVSMTLSLAEKINSHKDRDAFLKGVGVRTKLAPPPPRPSTLEETIGAARGTAGDAARGSRPLTPEDIARAVQLLAVQVGPIAHVLAKRVARPGCSREQFIAALAAHLSDDAERAGFLRALG
jgi:eukaryotic-like serine/threonine-protein kinase